MPNNYHESMLPQDFFFALIPTLYLRIFFPPDFNVINPGQFLTPLRGLLCNNITLCNLLLRPLLIVRVASLSLTTGQLVKFRQATPCETCQFAYVKPISEFGSQPMDASNDQLTNTRNLVLIIYVTRKSPDESAAAHNLSARL